MTFTVNVCSLLALYIVTPGPAMIRTVCKYSREILFTGIIFAFPRVSSESYMLV